MLQLLCKFFFCCFFQDHISFASFASRDSLLTATGGKFAVFFFYVHTPNECLSAARVGQQYSRLGSDAVLGERDFDGVCLVS